MMIRFKSQLMALLTKNTILLSQRIAVEPIIFTPEGKLILIKRGEACRDEVNNWECPGGDIGPHEDLYEALYSRINRKIGITVEILDFFDVRPVTFVTATKEVIWIIASYRCKSVSGTLPEGSSIPHKVAIIQAFDQEGLENVKTLLSQSMKELMKKYPRLQDLQQGIA